MGCPDWPRCFGRLVPPTSVDQLPADYKESYTEQRQKKNVRFARYLSALGFTEKADQVLHDRSILEESDFNVARTWTEYINRLASAVLGVFIVVLVFRSWKFRKSAPRIFWLSVATLLGVVFQAWFGSIVVSTNLTTWTITVHMFFALVLVGLLVYLVHYSDTIQGNTEVISFGLKMLLWSGFVVVLIQIFLGTEVREVIDQIASFTARNEWISAVGLAFIVHRSFSILVLVLNFVLFLKLRETSSQKILSHVLIILILGSTVTGVVMGYFAVPPYLQPVHLLLATITCGIQLLMIFRMNDSRKGATSLA